MRTRIAWLTAVLVLALAAATYAVGTLTPTTTAIGSNHVKISLAWTSTAGGAVSGNGVTVPRGRLVQVEFVPGSGGTQPSDLYDVTLVDTRSLDYLGGGGANLSNATSTIQSWDPPVLLDGTSQLDLVVANAGASKTGTVTLWISTSLF